MREEFVAVDVNGRRPFYRSVSWSAILAGLVVVLVCQILLTMLGVAIGAATIQPLQESNPAEGLGAGAVVWWWVTALISLLVGAFVAGRVLGFARRKDGALHGFLMWSSATALTFMLAGTVLGDMLGSGFAAIAEPGNRSEIESKIDEINPMKDSADYNRSADRNLSLTDEGDDGVAGTVDVDDDNPPVVGSQQEAELRRSGEEAASATSKAALMGLASLLIGALTCSWAGSRGVHEELGPPRKREAHVTLPGEPVRS
jgi:hypothetical protein